MLCVCVCEVVVKGKHGKAGKKRKKTGATILLVENFLCVDAPVTFFTPAFYFAPPLSLNVW